ncbi:S8 family serine peptidase [Agarilytica rhodophyticola]|uniref:S8 family serine peptidase n=1 Tax=Agarilytica rhodophyticola TaxID=1737490 RepID=UPI000B348632|nr:S8 family serine peptidase [Agarilytica rhodophyticola]
MKDAFIITFEHPITNKQKKIINPGGKPTKDAIEIYAKEDIRDPESLVKDNDILEFKDINAYVTQLSDQQREKLEKEQGISIEADSECFLQDAGEEVSSIGKFKSDLYDDGYIQALRDIGSDVTVNKLLDFRSKDTHNHSLSKKKKKKYKFEHLDRIKATKAWRRTKGRNVKLAVLDTGIDGLHNDLSVQEGVNFVSYHNNTLAHSLPWHDDDKHGTQCAGIIAALHNGIHTYGIAPEVELYAVKVLDSEKQGIKSRIIAGMLWCLEKKIDVISMSLTEKPCHKNAQYSAAYQAAAKKLEDEGCIIVAAAGNDGEDGVGEPARCPSVMAVTAVDYHNRKLEAASWGPSSLQESQAVEISAPGLNICSTAPHSRKEPISYTSAACPMVAAAAALVKQMHPTWTPRQIRQHLKNTATPLGATVKYGAGLLNCQKAVFGY